MTTVPVKIDPNSRIAPFYSYKNITTQTTTLVKSGAGFLHAITFNMPTTTATVKIEDALTDTTPLIGTIAAPATSVPFTLIYDIEFTTGLTIVTATANQDITVSYL